MTIISIGSEQRAEGIELKIYDATGRLVTSFGTTPYALRTTLLWNATDDAGNPIPPGVYFVRLHAQNAHAIKKIIKIN